MRVLAVDPGGTVGYAFWDRRLRIATQSSPMEFLIWAHRTVAEWEPVEVVVERFTITHRTIQSSREGSNTAIEVIGALRYLCFAYRKPFLPMQAPADVMRLVTNERLRLLNWYQPGKEHANDALRHLAYHLAKQGLLHLPV